MLADGKLQECIILLPRLPVCSRAVVSLLQKSNLVAPISWPQFFAIVVLSRGLFWPKGPPSKFSNLWCPKLNRYSICCLECSDYCLERNTHCLHSTPTKYYGTIHIGMCTDLCELCAGKPKKYTKYGTHMTMDQGRVTSPLFLNLRVQF